MCSVNLSINHYIKNGLIENRNMFQEKSAIIFLLSTGLTGKIRKMYEQLQLCVSSHSFASGKGIHVLSLLLI